MTQHTNPVAYLAFAGDECIARGSLPEVAVATRHASDARPEATIVVLHAWTSQVVDLDLRGSDEEIVARLSSPDAGAAEPDSGAQPELRTSGPGRPRLGVVSREVSLLPRHWAWLGTQRGGASAALRRLVDEARQKNAPQDRMRAAQESVDRFMRIMAGDRPNYEEALRAFYAGRDADLLRLVAQWPEAIRGHLEALLKQCRTFV